MKRRDFLGAIAGSFALTKTGRIPGAIAQERNTTRTLHESAAERLLQIYSYIPDTAEYEALAVGDALWSDIGKQFDAFGYRHSREGYFDQRGEGHFPWVALGYGSDSHYVEPHIYDYVPVLAADQTLQLGANPTELRLFTGIDPAVPAGIFQQKGYATHAFASGAVYIHALQDPLNRILWNRFAVLLDHGVLAWFNSEESAHDYASWKENGKSSLADNEAIRRALGLAESDAITYAWVDGSRLHLDGSVRKVLGDYASDEMVEAVREDLLPSISEQEQLFGLMPQIHTLTVGYDAGASSKPEPLVPGYDVPQAHVKLKLGSESDARLAAKIIEWRMENAISFVTRGNVDFTSFQPLPFDFDEARDGILIQRFGEADAARRIHGMLSQFDLAIYGWGEFS